MKELFQLNEIPEDVVNTINRFLEKGKTLNGIQKTLYYYYQILENKSLDIKKIKYIIEEYYDQTKKYFIKQSEIKKINENFVDNSRVVTVKINPDELFKKAREKNKINIEDL